MRSSVIVEGVLENDVDNRCASGIGRHHWRHLGIATL